MPAFGKIWNGAKLGANAAFVGLGAPSIRPGVTAQRMKTMFPGKAPFPSPMGNWNGPNPVAQAKASSMRAARNRGIRRTGALGGVAAYDMQNKMTQRNDAKYRERMRSASMMNGRPI